MGKNNCIEHAYDMIIFKGPMEDFANAPPFLGMKPEELKICKEGNVTFITFRDNKQYYRAEIDMSGSDEDFDEEKWIDFLF